MNMTNASANLANSTGSSFELAGIAFFVVISGVVATLLSQTVYSALVETVPAVVHSFVYAAKGFVVVVALGILTTPLYLFMQADQQAKTGVMKVVLGAIAAYWVLVAAGYVGDYAWQMLNTRHEEVTGKTLVERLETEEEGETA